MSTNLVIVAIPDESDRVWKVSSEPVPHLTILHLGDSNQVSNLEQIMLFVEHAANTSLKRFYLPVDRRGELGIAKADVLFFKKGRYDFKAVREFRSLLLQDQNIKTAYDATAQFELPTEVGLPGHPWIPHLTLGYPATPANPIPDDQNFQFYDVSFNKLAIWTGDFSGPDFLLKDYWDDCEAMDYATAAPLAMSSLNEARVAAGIEAVEHHGVKGMHWGQRKEAGSGKSPNSETKRVAGFGSFALLSPKFREHTSANTQKKVALFGNYALLDTGVRADLKQASKKIALDKADSQWDKGLKDGSAWVAVNNSSAVHFNKHIGDLNNKYPKDRDWSKEDYAHPKDPVFKKYMKDIDQLSQDSIKHAANELNLKNPSGTKEVEIKSSGLPGDFALSVKHVAHAADDNVIQIKVNYQHDAMGRVTGFTYSDDAETLAQTIDLGIEFLSHHGVKGMRWGQTKSKIIAGPKAVGRGAKKAGKGLVRFGKDVNFESRTTSRNDGRPSRAKNMVVDLAQKDFRAKDLAKINAKPEHVKASKLKNRLLNPRDPGTKAYRKEVKTAYIKRLETTANSITNGSGNRQYTIRERHVDLPAQGGALPTSKNLWDVTARNIEHATNSEDFTVEVIMDADGFITDTKPVDAADTMAQTVELGAEFLAHVGVKGMKWGQRKPPPAAVATTARSVVPHGAKRKTQIKTAGGENHDASPDAIRVAEAHAKLKKSGTAALSNKELQDVQTRLNLERNVNQLVGARTTVGKGRNFVKGLTGFGKEFNDTINTGLNSGRLVSDLRK